MLAKLKTWKLLKREFREDKDVRKMGESVYTASLSQQISYSIYLHRISIQHLAFPDLESLIRNRLFFFHPRHCLSVCNHCFSQNSLSMEQGNFQLAGGRWFFTKTQQSVEAKHTTGVGVKRKRVPMWLLWKEWRTPSCLSSTRKESNGHFRKLLHYGGGGCLCKTLVRKMRLYLH